MSSRPLIRQLPKSVRGLYCRDQHIAGRLNTPEEKNPETECLRALLNPSGSTGSRCHLRAQPIRAGAGLSTDGGRQAPVRLPLHGLSLPYSSGPDTVWRAELISTQEE